MLYPTIYVQMSKNAAAPATAGFTSLPPLKKEGKEPARAAGSLQMVDVLTEENERSSAAWHKAYAVPVQVGLTGLEPVTLRLSSACSNQLSYRPS
jgi:hypothetical protein